MRLLTIVALATVLLSCRSRSSRAGAPEPQRNGGGARCELARGSGESAECYAVRCAEAFIRHSGYTIEPPSGPEYADPLGIPLQQRRGTLYSAAIVHQWSSKGHFVGFRYRDSSDNVGRAVTMNHDFGNLILDRLNFVWSPASHLPECAPDAG